MPSWRNKLFLCLLSGRRRRNFSNGQVVMEHLPHELISWIFSSVSLFDIGRCRLVCSAWTTAINNLPTTAWKRIISELLGGRKPESRRAKRLSFSAWVNQTMNTFSSMIKKQKYELALRWSCIHGHHVLIRRLHEYSLP